MSLESEWPCPPGELILPPDEVHVWRANLNQTDSIVKWLIRSLSWDERIRANCFHFQRDRRFFIIRRGILRSILEYYLNIDAAQIRFCYGSEGKPALTGCKGEENLRFNVSHSNGIALYGVAWNREIGVDVEYLGEIPDMDLVVDHFFSSREKNAFHNLKNDEKKKAFYMSWTSKEAYVKAIGCGLRRSLESVDVSVTSEIRPQLFGVTEEVLTDCQWFVRLLTPGPKYIAAMAAEGDQWRLRCWQYSLKSS